MRWLGSGNAVLFSLAVNSDDKVAVPIRGRGDDFVWSLVGTLVGGPIAWGLVGWGVDTLLDTTRIFLPIGVAFGFITSGVLVYWRFGRD